MNISPTTLPSSASDKKLALPNDRVQIEIASLDGLIPEGVTSLVSTCKPIARRGWLVCEVALEVSLDLDLVGERVPGSIFHVPYWVGLSMLSLLRSHFFLMLLPGVVDLFEIPRFQVN